VFFSLASFMTEF